MDMPASYPGPRYKRLADDLCQLIADGTYRPGDQLPTEDELAARYGLSIRSVRDAFVILRGLGLVDTGSGKRTTVRVPPPKVVRHSTRYQHEKDQALLDGLPQSSHLAREMGYLDVPTQVRLLSSEPVAGDDDIAQALGVDSTTVLVRYSFLLSAGNNPGRIAHHYYTQALDDQVRARQPKQMVPWPGGTMHQLARLGIEPTYVVDRVWARMPLPDESRLLDMSEGVPLLIVRASTADDDGVVHEVKDVLMPADRTVLSYEMRLTSWASSNGAVIWFAGPSTDGDSDAGP